MSKNQKMMKHLILLNKIFISSELSNLRNFNEIFGENVSYDNIKIHKKQGFTASLENTVLQNPQWGTCMGDQLTL